MQRHRHIDRYIDIDIFQPLSVFGMHVAAVGVPFCVCHIYINLWGGYD